MKVLRPAVRYHGGKWVIAPRIIAHLPSHQVYVEPYGGGGSVLLRKPRVGHEVYNDLSGEMVSLFRVLRDHGEELRQKVLLTPFSREEYEASKGPSEDPVEQARRTLVRSFMGHGSDSLFEVSGFRSKSHGNNTGAAIDWMRYPDKLPPLIERLRGVVIEQRDAIEVMKQHDGPDTAFYVDPPYLQELRGAGKGRKPYEVDMTEEEHHRLAEVLRSLVGGVVLSGYPSPLYEELYDGWWRVELEGAQCHNRQGAKPTEVLWMNREPAKQNSLFGAVSQHL
jgi:DNA adenine methylase